MAGKSARGGEVWQVVDPSTGAKRVIVTSPESVAALDEITAAHSDALKRLANK